MGSMTVGCVIVNAFVIPIDDPLGDVTPERWTCE
jgi:hypothetical protein